MFQCKSCQQGILLDPELKALRVKTQALLGRQISGSIVVLWPDGKIAADELPYIIDVIVRE